MKFVVEYDYIIYTLIQGYQQSKFGWGVFVQSLIPFHDITQKLLFSP